MAEFLIRKTNHWTRDEYLKSSSMLTADQFLNVLKTHQQGDIVEIYEDGRCKEPPAEGSIYWIIKVPGVKKSDYEYTIKPQIHLETIDAKEVEIIDKRRRYRFPIESMPSEIVSRLEKERIIEIKAEDFKKYVYDNFEAKTIEIIEAVKIG